MEKITPEELMKMANLSEEDMEKVFGGDGSEENDKAKINEECMHECLKSYVQLVKCLRKCRED